MTGRRLGKLGGRANGSVPNVVMFYMDDLRDWVGYLDAHPGVHTPNIDALAARSMSFDRAYTAVPACLGSRVATLWSQSPVTTGVQHTGLQDPAARSYRRFLNSESL